MRNIENVDRDFTQREEALHAITHGLGAVAAVVGLVLLIMRASPAGALSVAAAAVFGVSLVILYSASCAFHTSCYLIDPNASSILRYTLMKCDYSMIYVLILGTYTPACAAMSGVLGAVIFAVVATCCLLGVTLNIYKPEKFRRLSMVLYLLAGWMMAIALVPFYKIVGVVGLILLLLGGVLYTVGIVFYKLQKIPYFHIIWHLFVIAGSVVHYLLVYLYCI